MIHVVTTALQKLHSVDHRHILVCFSPLAFPRKLHLPVKLPLASRFVVLGYAVKTAPMKQKFKIPTNANRCAHESWLGGPAEIGPNDTYCQGNESEPDGSWMNCMQCTLRQQIHETKVSLRLLAKLLIKLAATHAHT